MITKLRKANPKTTLLKDKVETQGTNIHVVWETNIPLSVSRGLWQRLCVFMQRAAVRFHLECTWKRGVPDDWKIAKCSADKDAVTNNESQGRVTAQGKTDCHHLSCTIHQPRSVSQLLSRRHSVLRKNLCKHGVASSPEKQENDDYV